MKGKSNGAAPPLLLQLEIDDAVWRIEQTDAIRRYHAQSAMDEILSLYRGKPLPAHVQPILDRYARDAIR